MLSNTLTKGKEEGRGTIPKGKDSQASLSRVANDFIDPSYAKRPLNIPSLDTNLQDTDSTYYYVLYCVTNPCQIILSSNFLFSPVISVFFFWFI